ncbi:MAG: hypothetical protein P8K27_00290 [Gammaproteobacteria bacterium]|nr:hypothetical protein [Gammaproteobacteria bacterium]
MNKGAMFGVSLGLVLIVGLFAWVLTAPYLSNQGLGRTPGLIIGGTLTEAPADFAPLNESVQGPLYMKQAGFPPFVVYLSWVGTKDGVITATRPDDGYWARRIRERGGDGWLRIGEATYSMEATEIHGDERIAMMEQWASKSGRSLDEPLYAGSEPLREWEVFFWEPK